MRVMSARLAVLLVLVAVGAGAAAGYALGARHEAGRSDAAAVRRAAAVTAFPPAYTRAFADEWRDGFLSGGADGVVQGDRAGAASGRRAGATAAQKVEVPVEPTPAAPGEHEVEAVPTAAPATGDVLVVGDSLEVLTSPYLQRYLPGVDLTIEAHGGFASPQLYDVFRDSFRPGHDVVVFDAGTNDSPLYPQILESKLAAVAGAVGDRCLVVPTIHSYVVDGVGDAGKNRVVRAFAASRPGTQTPDWQAAVAAHPELMQPDDLHPNTEGADFRARLIAEGVKACLALGGALAP
jgi:hypothetical protein